MNVRILNEAETRRLLPMSDCIEVVADALAALSRGDAVNPLRSALRFPDGSGVLGMMPAALGSPPGSAIKVVTVMPGNHGTSFDSHQGAVLVFEGAHGSLVGILEGSSITGIRTGAASAVATRVLAREDASILALLGSGVQAASHLEAMLLVRPVAEVRVWSRNPENARRFAGEAERRHRIPVKPVPGAEAAVRGADLICTVTSSAEPVLSGDWVAAGAHVNAVGACFARTRELDGALVARSRLFTDCRTSLENEAGDYRIPLEAGKIGPEHLVGEIGEVLLGKVGGRGSGEEITLFKSLGVGIEDLAAGRYVLERAEKEGAGAVIEFGGSRS